MKQHLDCLTTLRFFAAAEVVVYHCGRKALEGSPWWIQGMFQNGSQAVNFFFVLSGFVLTYSYYQDFDSTLRTSKKDFWIARIARIYPVYALALLISFIPYVNSAFFAHRTALPQFAGGIISVPLLLQAWIPQFSWEWNSPAWSLSVETFFYLLFPWLAIGFLGKTKPKDALLLSGMLVLVTNFINYRIYQSLEAGRGPTMSETMFMGCFPVWHLPSFMLGMALGRLHMVKHSRVLGDKTFIVVGGLLLAILAQTGRISSVFLSSMVLIPLFGILIFSAANCRGIIKKALSHPWLVFLGEASYCIYILHLTLAFWTNKIWEKMFGSELNFYIYFALMLIFCCLTFVLLETPARSSLSRTLKIVLRKRAEDV